MYIENKSGQLPGSNGLVGPARIGRVSFSKTKTTIFYSGKRLRKLHGGYKVNYFDVETGEEYWISGPHKDAQDGLYGYRPTPIDADAREEYWVTIRNEPSRKLQAES